MSRIVDAEKKKNLCARLARIEGQVRGLQKLIEADADCENGRSPQGAGQILFLDGRLHDRARRPDPRKSG